MKKNEEVTRLAWKWSDWLDYHGQDRLVDQACKWSKHNADNA